MFMSPGSQAHTGTVVITECAPKCMQPTLIPLATIDSTAEGNQMPIIYATHRPLIYYCKKVGSLSHFGYTSISYSFPHHWAIIGQLHWQCILP